MFSVLPMLSNNFMRWIKKIAMQTKSVSAHSRRRLTGNRPLAVEFLEERTTLSANQSLVLSPTALPADLVDTPYGQAYTASGDINTFYANQVVSYAPGTLADPTYDNPNAALGGLNPVTGSFDGSNYYLTPFDPAFSSSDLVEVGAGGSLILKLSQTASTNGYTIGVHTGFGLADADYPNGTNTDPATYFSYFQRQADVLVSADGVNWGNLGTITFNNPSNYYAGTTTDPEGLSPGVGPLANPGEPFLGSLSSFNGENWQSTLATLNGSAGGTWLNLGGVTDENGNPISGVNYIEFVVPSNPPLDPNTGYQELMMVGAVVGTNGGATISANGGSGDVALKVSDIQNPIPGLIVPASGTNSLAISGTPTSFGTETFTVTAVDSIGAVVNQNYSITVNPITLSPPNLPADTVNVPYNQTISAEDGTGQMSFAVSNVQNAIAGLDVPANGTNGLIISGTPTSTGTESFTLTVTDSNGMTIGQQNYSITINPASTLSPSSLPADTVNALYNQTISAEDGTGQMSFAVSNIQNAIPGLNVPANGTNDLVITGTPTVTGTETFTVTVTDSVGATTTANYSIAVNPRSTLSIRAVQLPIATVDDQYSAQLLASGGSGVGYSFTASGLPAGLTMSRTGLISGTPQATSGLPTTVTISVLVNDSRGDSGYRTFELTLDPALSINPITLGIATAGDPIHKQLTATGGSDAGYTFKGIGLPYWLTLSPGGLLIGTPPVTAGATVDFSVDVTDNKKGTGSTEYTVQIDPAVQIGSTTLSVVTVGNSFSTQMTAAGGSGTGYMFTASGMPAWMTLTSDGLLSGTPTTNAGSPIHFTIAVTDSE
ncbi:MAG TPA: putative Ig domain-containing protein, partial [Gemmata sp.]|nr:putative Ig domain-containing protein [Gemmata sp.]